MTRPPEFSPIATGLLTAAMIALLAIAAVKQARSEPVRVSQSVASLECVPMSDQAQSTLNFLAWTDAMIARQRRAGLTTGDVLNINALDQFDPVHVRNADSRGELDCDGDLGRQHDDYQRDNGVGASRGTVAGAFVRLAAALPVIAAPSIVAAFPATQSVKAESE